MNAPPHDPSTPALGPDDERRAATNVRSILDSAVQYDEEQAAIVVFDTKSELARCLTEGYRRSLPEATFINFDTTRPQTILAAFEILEPSDLVVLIQSASFRLAAFRIRVELFQRSIKVIEHPHLARMPGPEGAIYVDSLAYDPDYYRGVGGALKERLDKAQTVVIDSGGAELVFPAGLESARLNVGDYRQMKNVGGQYPIGEVFTESRDLEQVHGQVRIGIFADTSFTVNKPDRPITLVVERGRVTEALDSNPAFDAVLQSIREDEGEVWMRELGLGMNRAFHFDRLVSDVGSFERMCGVHLSLGSKHHVYNKPGIRKRSARQHVDVFVLTESVRVDGEELYIDGEWLRDLP
jgi:aminopeptidase